MDSGGFIKKEMTLLKYSWGMGENDNRQVECIYFYTWVNKKSSSLSFIVSLVFVSPVASTILDTFFKK